MTTNTLTLTDFLLARIAEERSSAEDRMMEIAPLRGGCRGLGCLRRADQPHAFGCPQRALAECEAKRRIMEGHAGWHVCPNLTNEGYADYGDGSGDDWEEVCPTLRALAAIYDDHPDYRDEWKP